MANKKRGIIGETIGLIYDNLIKAIMANIYGHFMMIIIAPKCELAGHSGCFLGDMTHPFEMAKEGFGGRILPSFNENFRPLPGGRIPGWMEQFGEPPAKPEANGSAVMSGTAIFHPLCSGREGRS
jgi:hypothetical protein